MKINHLYLILILTAGIISCDSDFLNQVPDDRLTLEETFSRRSTLEQYLANVYSRVPDELGQRSVGHNNAGPWTGHGDEAEYVWTFVTSNDMNIGAWDPTSGFVRDFWNNYYRGIRAASELILYVDQCGDCGQQLIDQYRAEARTLRALYYFNLIKMYGPIVLLPEQPIEPDAQLEELLMPRSTLDECVQYVISELDLAASILPVEPRNNDAYGRMTRPFALAVKSQVLLFSASPLFNGNPDLAGLVNPDGTALVQPSYDGNKWQIAADAAKAFIDEFVPGQFGLFRKNNVNGEFDPYLSCRDVMLEDWNQEVIMARPGASVGPRQYELTPFHSGSPGEARGSGGLGATQNMVNAYFMDNGRTIEDPASGYRNEGFSDFQAPYDFEERQVFNPWVNREPRFYVGITYDNSLWLNRNIGDIITRTWYNGNSGRNVGGNDYSPTGYIVRKNMALGNWNSGNRTMVMLRLAEIYLNYAEALNESSPGHPDILFYLNEIRERAGIPALGTEGLEVPASQEEMREAIRRERRVELAFENVRYFDACRWKIATEVFDGPMYGMDINAEEVAGFYSNVVFETRTFNERHYLWPIPQSEINTNRQLVQNPGW